MFEDPAGAPAQIDSRLVTSSQSDVAAQNAANSFVLEVPQDPSLTPVVLEDKATGAWVSSKMNGLRGAPTISGSRASFANVQDADKMLLTSHSTGVKEDIVLNDAPAPDDPLEFTYEIDASPDLDARQSAAGVEFFERDSGDVLFRMPIGVSTDASGLDSSAVDVDLTAADTGWLVTARPDNQWLQDPARQFPVKIDPSLEAATILDCTLHKVDPDLVSCGNATRYMRVGTTSAGATTRSVTRFDVNSIPYNATIESASVALYLDSSQTAGTSTSASYGLFNPMTRFDTSASWNKARAGSTWTGGSPSAALSDALTMGGLNSGYKRFSNAGPAVQDWVDGSSTNRGFVFKQTTEDQNQKLGFYSSSTLNSASVRPYLDVVYNLENAGEAPTPEPGGPVGEPATPGSEGGGNETSTPGYAEDVPPDYEAKVCVIGIGGDCDRTYTNKYGNKVIVFDEVFDYVRDKHGLSRTAVRYVIEEAVFDNSIHVSTATRRGYRMPIRRMECDPRCHDAGVQVNVIAVVEWAGHGPDKGELVTMYCKGYSGKCPKWIRAI
ncbi:DNRLRE domain-containing protein [uncultured Nocardioides sp.]|uniref:DNRLRE domain-containing protein n=1 Tax=uncultured Nocardioides sp. TaxID=198441 RepID=UPI002637D593|nr:DNRLRE domain-containing protein [uncultured Nocardioides sp.]